MSKIEKSDAQWKKELSLEQYDVLRGKGTEAPFSGEYDSTFDAGSYSCATCGGHLGYIFEGEGFGTPTDQRYCINSLSLKFKTT